ncbi:MAG: hypothetical protein H6Q17_877 [Bacteroidetes bacterium]|nr:hypothetical protein [Bacteroidota bacterium]
MARIPRIPRTINEFDIYLANTAAYMQQSTPPNGIRLGLSDAEIARWEAYRVEWSPLYRLYADKKNGRTTAVRDQLLALIDSVVAYDRTNHLLDRIASSTAAVIADYEIFNIKSGSLKKSGRSVPTASIVEQIAVRLLPLGGGMVTVKCYTITGGRAAIYEGGDSVQYLYCVGTEPPVSAEADGLKSGLSTRGILSLDLGSASCGKKLYIYLRWYNTRHPRLAGPWCPLQSTLIL